MKTILLFSIAVLLVCHILIVEATNSTKYVITVCDNQQIYACPDKTVIKEQYDKQISNLNNTIADLNANITGYKNIQDANNTWKNVGTGFGIVGSIVGIVGGIYGIKKKRDVSNSQLKTEQVKRGAYRPTLIVRKTLVGGVIGFTLQMVNIGNVGAKNIIYSITDEKNQNLTKDVKIPALKVGEEKGTGISWKPVRKVKVTVSYEGPSGEKYSDLLEEEF